MHEIELKFQVPEGQREALRQELGRLGASLGRPQVLQAAYFDTADRRLGQARAALRVRREGSEWVQTLKAAGQHTMHRLEDNRPATPAAEGTPLRPNLGLHTGDARSALCQALGWQPESDPQGQELGLEELYRTDIRRTLVRMTVDQGGPHAGVVELALDEGLIGSGPCSEPVCELEIELLSGHPQAVIDVGRLWVQRFGLWLDTRTKAHRGDAQARRAEAMRAGTLEASPQASAHKPRPARLTPEATARQAWETGLATCLSHISDHMSALSSLPDDAPLAHGLHAAYEWRRGLRRLRSFGRLWEAVGWPGLEASSLLAAELARQLGHWRDNEVLADLPVRMAAQGGPDLPLPPSPHPAPQAASPMALARCAAATELCLQLLSALVQPPLPASGECLRASELIGKRLGRWHRRGRHEAQSLDEASHPSDWHQVRRRLRRLRDAADLHTALWPAEAQASQRQALSNVLDAMGQLQDEVAALERYQADTAHPRAQAACDWLKARQPALKAQAHAALRAWQDTPSPW